MKYYLLYDNMYVYDPFIDEYTCTLDHFSTPHFEEIKGYNRKYIFSLNEARCIITLFIKHHKNLHKYHGTYKIKPIYEIYNIL